MSLKLLPPSHTPSFLSPRLFFTAILIILTVIAILIARHFQSLFSITGQGDIRSECVVPNDNHKFDCYPEDNGNKAKCEERGCCWVPNTSNVSIPWCFYPPNYRTYSNVNVSRSEGGIVAYMVRNAHSPYDNDVPVINIRAEYQTEDRLRIKLEDSTKRRFEAIYPIIEPEKPTFSPAKKQLNYVVEISTNDTGFQVKRPNGNLLFNAQGIGGFIFADQFLQLSAGFNGEIYGIGQHQTTLALDKNWSSFTLWNRDMIPVENMNLYGSHPFYMVVEADGSAHGVFLRNSNAMDIVLQPLPAVTFRAIGGIFDFYFFMGPTPGDVIAQYTELIGRAAMPPYWALGFQLCRLGYKNDSHVEAVLKRNLEAGIPVDVQWIDMDYMKNRNDFTLDNETFGQLPGFISKLHEQGMRFVPMLDPGISAGEPNGTYPPFDEAVRLGVLVKNPDGSPFIGKVWNRNSTAFPDFTNNDTLKYWSTHLKSFHDLIPYDGLWIDMNEPSNFLDGSINGCPNNSLEYPAYLPASVESELFRKTLCMSAVHAAGSHYDIHNVYGISEAHVTNSALKEIFNTRPFIISRSTFPGIGRYAGSWSGDVASTWHDMKRSISQMLSFSLFGVPLMGSDICGFNGNTTEHLCMRWSQLGAFYPFSRNHNTDDTVAQDPAGLGRNVVESAKRALNIRYALLPYLYTLFWRSFAAGETVARPLFVEFPWDNNTHRVDESFLWGCCVLIVPVLEDQATTVTAYLPAGRWYNWYSLMAIETSGGNFTLDAPSDTIPVLVRGGSVIITQLPALNTALSRKNKLTLLAASNASRSAAGYLYWDDGVSLDNSAAYGLVDFQLNPNNLTSNVRVWSTGENPVLDTIQILGFMQVINETSVNGSGWPFSWNSSSLVLTVDKLNWPINKPFTLTWT